MVGNGDVATLPIDLMDEHVEVAADGAEPAPGQLQPQRQVIGRAPLPIATSSSWLEKIA